MLRKKKKKKDGDDDDNSLGEQFNKQQPKICVYNSTCLNSTVLGLIQFMYQRQKNKLCAVTILCIFFPTHKNNMKYIFSSNGLWALRPM